jgi:predicted transglutaminase-like cysteine proteinase
LCGLVLLGTGTLALDLERMRAVVERVGKEEGRARFSGWRGVVAQLQSLSEEDKLRRVNDYFNRIIRWSDDRQVWGADEYWATTLETLGMGAGDCEDFVIAKYFTLQELGVPVEKLRFTYVRAVRGPMDDPKGLAHMVLSYYESPRSEPVVLDNLVREIQPASARTDLRPVFTFNALGIWGAGQTAPRPIDRYSRWKELLIRMNAEGHTP